MELALLVYAISLLPKIISATSFLMVTSAIGGAVFALISFVSSIDARHYEWWNGYENLPGFKHALKVLLPVFLLSGFIQTLTPSEKTAYVMVGAYATQTIAMHPNTQQIGGKVLTIINQKLDYYAQEGEREIAELMKKKEK